METQVILTTSEMETLKEAKRHGVWLIKTKYPFSKRREVIAYRDTVPVGEALRPNVDTILDKIRDAIPGELGNPELLEIEIRPERHGKDAIARAYFIREDDQGRPAILERRFVLSVG